MTVGHASPVLLQTLDRAVRGGGGGPVQAATPNRPATKAAWAEHRRCAILVATALDLETRLTDAVLDSALLRLECCRALTCCLT